MGHSQSSGPVLERAWPTPELTPARKPVREAERPDPRFGRRSVNASIRPASPRESQREDRAAGGPSSIGRSLRRALFRFLLAVLVGVGGTLGWQSYGEQMLAAHAPTLAWLFSISASKPPSAAATASDTTRVAPPAANLDEVRRSLEQLSAKQEQMAQDIAALQAIEDDIRQKMSFTPPSPASVPPVASVLQPRPGQPKAQPSVMQLPRPPQATAPAVR
jgi:hypothetical protein